MKKLMLAFVLLLGVVVSVKAQSIYGDASGIFRNFG